MKIKSRKWVEEQASLGLPQGISIDMMLLVPPTFLLLVAVGGLGLGPFTACRDFPVFTG